MRTYKESHLRVAFVKQCYDIFGPWSTLRWRETTPRDHLKFWPYKSTLWEMTCLLEADWYITPYIHESWFVKNAIFCSPERKKKFDKYTRAIVPPTAIPFEEYDVVITFDPILRPPHGLSTVFAYFMNEHCDPDYKNSCRSPLNGYDLFLDHLLTFSNTVTAFPQSVSFPYLRDFDTARSIFNKPQEEALWVDARTIMQLANGSTVWNVQCDTIRRDLEQFLSIEVRTRKNIYTNYWKLDDPPAWNDPANYMEELSRCRYYLSLTASGAGQGICDAASLGLVCLGTSNKPYHTLTCAPQFLCRDISDAFGKLHVLKESGSLGTLILSTQDQNLATNFQENSLTLLHQAVLLKRARQNTVQKHVLSSEGKLSEAISFAYGILLDNETVKILPESTTVGGSWQGKNTDGIPISWETKPVKFVHNLLQRCRYPFILDVGANTGTYCLLPALNPSISGFAFEPNPQIANLLKSNLRLNNIQDKIKIVSIALADKEGSVCLKIPKSGTDSGLACIGAPLRFNDWREIEVPVTTLDKFAEQQGIKYVDLLKIDTEGCELFVLLGAEKLIKRDYPGILLEYHAPNTRQFGYEPEALIKLLFSWGYDNITKVSKEDIFLYKTDSYICSALKSNSVVERNIEPTSLTIFTIPKPFKGHENIIQRNAIQSWLALEPRPDIILLGDDEGVAEVSKEFGIKHIGNIAVNEYGTPLISDVFEKAQSDSNNNIMAYVNADIILMQDFISAANVVSQKFTNNFLAIGQRWDVDIFNKIDFNNAIWRQNLKEIVHTTGKMHASTGKDYFVFKKGLWSAIPPFAIGRGHFDNWLVFSAFVTGFPVIDATNSVLAVHQNHNYNHMHGSNDVWLERPECLLNRSLAGYGAWHGHINNATWVFSDDAQLIRQHNFENIYEIFSTIDDLLSKNLIADAIIFACQVYEQKPHLTEVLQQKINTKTDKNLFTPIITNNPAPPVKKSDLQLLKLYAGDLPNKPEYNGWLGLSLTQQNERHMRHDITKSLPFADNSVDAFQAEDVFEHIQYDKLLAVINDIYRILKPGGLFRLSVPDYGCDILRERSIKDTQGNIIFDPGGGGTPDNPGHVWFPRINTVHQLLKKTLFQIKGSIEFLHYWNIDNKTFVTKPIDYTKGHINRTPDHDDRVKDPYRPMSIVVDMYKNKAKL